MNIAGKLVEVMDTEKISDSFSKKVFVVNDCSLIDPQNFKFELSNKHMPLIDKFKTGEMINVSFNMRSKDWIDRSGKVRTFITLHAWKIEELNSKPESVSVESEQTESTN